MAWGLHYFDDKILLDKRLKSCFAYLFYTKITQSTTSIADCFLCDSTNQTQIRNS